MERRKAAGLAGAVSLVAAAGVFAVGANFGLFGMAAAAPEAPPLPVSVPGIDAPAPVTPGPETPGPAGVVEEIQVIDVPVYVPQGSTVTPAPGSDDSTVVALDPPTIAAPPMAGDDDGTAGGAAVVDGRPAPSAAPTYGEPEDGVERYEPEREVEPCEVHDDGLVECHDHADD